jgi:hypothetical protein
MHVTFKRSFTDLRERGRKDILINFFKNRAIFVFLSCLILISGSSLVSTVFASGLGNPSNAAGIWHMEFEPGKHLISFPILPENAQVLFVLGHQFPGADAEENATTITTIEEGQYISSYYNSVFHNWYGDISALYLNKGYWINIPGDETISLTLIGAALERDSVDMGNLEQGFNLVSAGMIYPLSIAATGLIESGFQQGEYFPQSDKVFSFNSETNDMRTSYPINGRGWRGYGINLTPEKGYLIEVSNETAINWIIERPEGILNTIIVEEGIEPSEPLSRYPVMFMMPEILPSQNENSSKKENNKGSKQ